MRDLVTEMAVRERKWLTGESADWADPYRDRPVEVHPDVALMTGSCAAVAPLPAAARKAACRRGRETREALAHARTDDGRRQFLQRLGLLPISPKGLSI